MHLLETGHSKKLERYMYMCRSKESTKSRCSLKTAVEQDICHLLKIKTIHTFIPLAKLAHSTLVSSPRSSSYVTIRDVTITICVKTFECLDQGFLI